MALSVPDQVRTCTCVRPLASLPTSGVELLQRRRRLLLRLRIPAPRSCRRRSCARTPSRRSRRSQGAARRAPCCSATATRRSWATLCRCSCKSQRSRPRGATEAAARCAPTRSTRSTTCWRTRRVALPCPGRSANLSPHVTPLTRLNAAPLRLQSGQPDVVAFFLPGVSTGLCAALRRAVSLDAPAVRSREAAWAAACVTLGTDDAPRCVYSPPTPGVRPVEVTGGC